MPAFVSPVDPASWNLATVDAVTIPAGLRYGGYAYRALRATQAGVASVLLPATGVLRMIEDSGLAFVELQVIPFPIRHVANALTGGLPTFYLVFDDVTGLVFSDGDGGAGGDVLRTASAVTIVIAMQDRMMRDPALAASRISSAITAGGGDASQWGPFADAIAAATGSGDTAPVLLYDHAGRLRDAGEVDVALGSAGAETVHHATLDPADHGDLQRTVARLNAADPGAMPIASLWGGGRTSFRLRPTATAGDAQLVRLDDGLVAATEIEITPALRNIAFTDLALWFAPQSAATGGEEDLARFSRGNLVTPLVNGPSYFDDFFAKMRDAQRADGGAHLAGWAMFPQTKFVRREPGDDPEAKLTLDMANDQIGDDNMPLTIEQAASLIGNAGGASRFLPVRMYQLEDGSVVSAAEAVTFELIVDAILILNMLGVSAAKTDASGALVLITAWLAATIYTAIIMADDGRPLEPNKDAVDVLDAVTNTVSVFSPFPARVEDNVPAPSLGDFPFSTIFTVTRHFGVYHQKMAVVKVGTEHFAWCGGIDCNPDRLDTSDHLAKGPFHDVHARIEGNAVRDIARTFDQRWQRDGGGDPPAFGVPPVDGGLAPGGDIAQIARTYFAPAIGAEARALAFAPTGDRTIADTMIAAIVQARDIIYIEDQYLTPPAAYRDALIAKVSNREIKQLVIVVPGLTDQPFGVAFRDQFVQALVAADGDSGIVRVGYPRRRFTSTDNALRASSGKMLLGQDLAAGGGTMSLIFLGPPARIPKLPFWVSVEGELIYVYDESGAPNPEPDNMKVFLCERGDATQIAAGGASPSGAFPRAHKRGAPATAIDLSNIYVHAKMMIVDDVFLGLGSANLNHRGLFYDGEINCFTIPDGLRASPRNPALLLRRQLWAEMLDLPADMAAPLLTDPIAAAKLFDRSPFAGNRFVPLDAQPPHLMLGYTTSDGVIGDIIQGLGFAIVAANWPTLFTQVVDPSSRTETA